MPSASVMAEAKAGNPRQKSREEWRHSFFSSVIFCKENKMQVVVGGGTEKTGRKWWDKKNRVVDAILPTAPLGVEIKARLHTPRFGALN